MVDLFLTHEGREDRWTLGEIAAFNISATT